MTTVVNNPAPASDSGGSSFLIGIIILVGFVLIFLYYGLPAIRNMGLGQSPQINIPGKIDVNVNQTK